ncbi:hypothetical protein SAMN05216228_10824 [Rhizobium tibeticum]|uniref:Uncharacterized protein n=1 Tax=Rhizobium tibeticum TaxID=501024 RepID=A0A1H8WXQ8_9HYPH|nr:hypothetical protein RTCCBAU85039_6739 [Rhizobium tibeticum]SEP31878.1 hypothetical protein SAMN05216228_10824 [Rhizobium tibeticum]
MALTTRGFGTGHGFVELFGLDDVVPIVTEVIYVMDGLRPDVFADI